MSIVNTLALESNRQIKINFDGGDFIRCRLASYQRIHKQTWY